MGASICVGYSSTDTTIDLSNQTKHQRYSIFNENFSNLKKTKKVAPMHFEDVSNIRKTNVSKKSLHLSFSSPVRQASIGSINDTESERTMGMDGSPSSVLSDKSTGGRIVSYNNTRNTYRTNSIVSNFANPLLHSSSNSESLFHSTLSHSTDSKHVNFTTNNDTSSEYPVSDRDNNINHNNNSSSLKNDIDIDMQRSEYIKHIIEVILFNLLFLFLKLIKIYDI